MNESRPNSENLCTELTILREQLRALAESEDRFRTAQETSLQGFAILEAVRDRDGRVVDLAWIYRNPAAARLSPALASSDYEGKRVLGSMPDGVDARNVFDTYVRVLETGAPEKLESRIVRDRVERWFLISVTRIHDNVAVSFDEITERKRAERQRDFLAEAATVLASSLDYQATLASVARLSVPLLADWCAVDILEEGSAATCQVAVAHVDPKKVELAHDVGRRYPPDPNAATGVPNVMRTGKSELYAEIPDALLEVGAIDAEHLRILRELELKSVLMVPLTARGRTLGVITLIYAESGRRFDASDLAFAEELARRAAIAVDNARLYKQAQDAVQLRDDFLSIASHELNTPLTPLKMQLAMLRDRPAPPEKLRSRLDVAARQVDRLTKLVSQLLDVSRIAAHRLSIEPEPTDLVELLHDVVDRQREVAPTVSILFDAPPSAMGHVDAARIEQVLTNLLSNAVKYGEKKPVHVTLTADAGHATIAVRDSGIGIAPDKQARIFDRFERAVSSRHYGGFGLGLWISRQIVDASGGHIVVASEPGKGSTFTVVLPLEGGTSRATSNGSDPR